MNFLFIFILLKLKIIKQQIKLGCFVIVNVVNNFKLLTRNALIQVPICLSEQKTNIIPLNCKNCSATFTTLSISFADN